jgi:lipoate---protein ligase
VNIDHLFFIEEPLDVVNMLALEEEISLRQGDQSDSFYQKMIVLIWRSKPCVVIGRFQNPWLEVNLQAARDYQLSIIRRRSGGGTVYHDEGNFCFSFLYPQRDVPRTEALLVLQDFLTTQGLATKIGDKGDLYLLVKGEERKITGSAYRQKLRSSYHHFTLLFSADLARLKASCQHNADQKEIYFNRSLPSRPARVGRLEDHLPYRLLDFSKRLRVFFSEKSLVISETLADFKHVQRYEEEKKDLQKKEWIWGETPQWGYFKGSTLYWFQKNQWWQFDAIRSVMKGHEQELQLFLDLAIKYNLTYEQKSAEKAPF